ncbi:MAG: pyridoxal-phosphate dependent enzyme, partial [Cyanobacteria bacterium REEB65]|nr:pyridoxal-phosphate dependent enzyme [Cyanobacteria bacterium REEB65]
GARIVMVDGTYDEAKAQAAAFAEAKGMFSDRGVRTVAAVEGMKTLAFEIAEQLGWRGPDWYFQGVSGGMGPVGVAKGFSELLALGLVDKVPSLGLVQAAGCAPMAAAFAIGLRQPMPVRAPATAILPLATGDPGPAYEILLDQLSQAGGSFTTATDLEAREAAELVARTEGIAIEPAAAVAFAGLGKLVRAGIVDRSAKVVVNASGRSWGSVLWAPDPVGAYAEPGAP